MRTPLRRSPVLLAALGTFVLAGAALWAVRPTPRLALPAAAAIRAVHRAMPDIPQLHGLRYDRVTVLPVDARLVRVSFWRGERISAEAAVRSDGTVLQGVNFARLAVPYGNWLAYQPAVLVLLAALFALCAAVRPLRSWRNLDVAAALSLVVPVILLQHRLLEASILSSVPGLLLLAGRLAWRGLGPPPGGLGRPARGDAHRVPLLEALTPGWSARERVRLLRLLVGALALIFLMVGITSTNAVDVLYAVMEGATKLIHGILPYGHMPGDVIHGDTYPIGSYALYAPLAALAPVTSNWDSIDAALGFTAVAALGCALALCRARAGGLRRREPEAQLAGLRTALIWLSFPPLLITVSTGTTDVALAALLLGAVLLWRRPGAATAMLALGGWFKLAPFALLPLWLAPLRGRRLGSALAGAAGVSAVALAVVVALGGLPGVGAMVHAVAYQFSRGSPQSVWSVLGGQSLQPLGQAGALALIAAAVVRLATDPALAADPRRVAALAGAVLVSIQLAADYWAFLYLVWIVPLLTLSLFDEPVVEPVRESVAASPSGTARGTGVPVGAGGELA